MIEEKGKDLAERAEGEALTVKKESFEWTVQYVSIKYEE